jgi:DnaJ-class molecular chaperone
MDRAELARCFRTQAKETHPDKGGDHKMFVKLKEAYECLLRRKA